MSLLGLSEGQILPNKGIETSFVLLMCYFLMCYGLGFLKGQQIVCAQIPCCGFLKGGVFSCNIARKCTIYLQQRQQSRPCKFDGACNGGSSRVGASFSSLILHGWVSGGDKWNATAPDAPRRAYTQTDVSPLLNDETLSRICANATSHGANEWHFFFFFNMLFLL